MPWPFSRKKKATAVDEGPRPEAPRAAGADQERVDEILVWLTKNLAGTSARPADDGKALHVGAPPTGVTLTEPGTAPAGAVLKVKRGKLAWVDLYDPALREPINQLIKHLDRQQKWSFNGVVSTKYVEPRPGGP